MTVLLDKVLRRRALLQALLAAPTFSLFRASPPVGPATPERDDTLVEVNGWILKRSDLA